MVVRRLVHALGDVVRLLVIANHDRTTFVVDTVIGVVVANTLDRVACDLDVVDMCIRGDLACKHYQASVGQCFSGNAAAWVLREDRVQNRIGNLIRYFVGVAF